MNAYFFGISPEERNNILDQHKQVYDGAVTQYVKPEVQPLYVQDFANDKGGVTVNNKGEVMQYKNMNINESDERAFRGSMDPYESKHLKKHLPKSKSDDFGQDVWRKGMEKPYSPIKKDDLPLDKYLEMKKRGEVDEMIDFIADGPNDLEHGVYGHEDNMCTNCNGSGYDDSTDRVCEWCGGEGYLESDSDDMEDEIETGIFFTTDDDEDIINLEDEDVIKLEESINESLNMFKRFKKYN
jgi:hypothetical protein